MPEDYDNAGRYSDAVADALNAGITAVLAHGEKLAAERAWRDAYERGKRDNAKGRPRLFRETRAFGIIPECDDIQADDWTEDAKRAYIAGYDEDYDDEE